jgi:hypothetical protein
VTDAAWIPLSQGKIYWSAPAYVHNLAYDSLGLIPLSQVAQIYLTSHEKTLREAKTNLHIPSW